MDTLHAPTPAPARDKAVNGGHAHVITSLNSPLLPPKVAHVAPPAHVPPTHMASPLLRHRTPVAGSPLLAHHQRHPPAPTDSPKSTHKEPPPAHSSPATGQRSVSSGESEAGGDAPAPLNGRASGSVREEDSSDTDMEIKSLDLTARVSLRQREGPEKERPMSWEGELSDSEITKHEHTMRVDAEEPMSPMSPMSQGSDHDHDKPTVRQVKVEESGSEEQTVFSSQPASQTDSPVPPRSDSGCEVHPGPYTPSQSPLLPRLHPHTHSPTHLYSPTQSPGPSRHVSGFSSPYSHTPSTGLSRNNSDASQYGGSYNSYSSAPSPISPTHYSPSQSPIQQRHITYQMPPHQSPNLGRVPSHPSQYPGAGPGGLYSAPLDLRESHNLGGHPDSSKDVKDDERLAADLSQHSVIAAQSGITRQQLINSPCPICGDKISGFHYGIFSCESCKGFFKRTVQNKKNYVCMRGSSCPITINTRKKCPGCRFEKCLCMGMKLEAIREDRTRGGRSTYQCAPYPLPPSLVTPQPSTHHLDQQRLPDASAVKAEPSDSEEIKPSPPPEKPPIPLLLQQIHDVEHLWHCSESEMAQLRQSEQAAREAMENNSPNFLNNLCTIADHRLYKIVKWCKSLPLFRHITIDDQICLLINSWCELLLLSCCFRSMESPGEIRVSSGRTMTLEQAEVMGIGPCIERMLNLTQQLRRLQVDKYEYMAMKVIVLLYSVDVSGLEDGEKVRYSQEKVVQALQEYTLSHYPHLPPKFGELLLRIPELQRTCQASKEMLSMKKKEGDVPSFNFLFELLRGDH
ncbi:nuclear hormone receptor FTZ-F1 beta-like isoform X3 [Penaeus japonicus]|uniref:nuclear hormone receptor FTZ-F1 beta-like isoform X3 n=1 Tax=Penaeus japonicus TaxID=27405 RepID=UPI001C71534F|nr:nuclear hormone receptor FTZ-F1 beta-like isoform X3 [Penaeus japonicus]